MMANYLYKLFKRHLAINKVIPTFFKFKQAYETGKRILLRANVDPDIESNVVCCPFESP